MKCHNCHKDLFIIENRFKEMSCPQCQTYLYFNNELVYYCLRVKTDKKYNISGTLNGNYTCLKEILYPQWIDILRIPKFFSPIKNDVIQANSLLEKLQALSILS